MSMYPVNGGESIKREDTCSHPTSVIRLRDTYMEVDTVETHACQRLRLLILCSK